MDKAARAGGIGVDQTLYHILVVDDERIERECIRFLIDKEKLPFEVRDIDDGLDALELMREWPVDILITDIQMPRMSGLDLVKRAKEIFPALKTVFFSGYADFEYARTAVTLGAETYLVKPINPEELGRVLDKLLEELDDSQTRQRQQFRQKSVMTQYALQRAIRGDESHLMTELEAQADWHGYYSYLVLMFLEDILDNATMNDLLTGLQEALGLRMDALEIDEHQRLLFLRGKNQEAQELGERAAAYLAPRLSHRFYLAFSDSMKEYASVKQAYETVQKRMSRRFWTAESAVFYEAEDRQPAQLPENEIEDTDPLKYIQEDLANSDAVKLSLDLEMLFKRLRKPAKQSQFYVKFIFSNLISSIYPQLCAARAAADKPVPKLDVMISQMYTQQSIGVMIGQVQALADEVVASMQSPQDTGLRREVQIVQRYVLQNYANDLSVEMLADLVYLAPDYLNRLFKKATGRNVGQYIRQVRMDNASRLLLETERKVMDICGEVGYPNYSYFCQSFRDYFGKSPERYRKEGGGNAKA